MDFDQTKFPQVELLPCKDPDGCRNGWFRIRLGTEGHHSATLQIGEASLRYLVKRAIEELL